jgi:hypothetical protein
MNELTTLDSRLTPMQEAMFLQHLRAPESGINIEQVVCDLAESVDPERLREAWQATMAGHAALRTSLHWKDGAAPFQTVHEVCEIPVNCQDWSLSSPAGQQEKLAAFLNDDRRRGFDLSQPPLMRVNFFRLDPAHFKIVWTFHHCLLDGRSIPTVLEEVLDRYERGDSGWIAGASEELPYASWWEKYEPGPSAQFWNRVLSGFENPTPLVGATAVAAETHRLSGTSRQSTRLSAGVTERLCFMASESGVTLNTFVQGAWALILSRYTGEEDVVFGAVRACRHALEGVTDRSVGMFINTVPVRARVAPELKLLTWLSALRQQQVALRRHELTPLRQIQEWSNVAGGGALFQSIVIFDHRDLNATLRARGGAWERRSFELREQTGFPVTLYAFAEPELTIEIAYERSAFEASTIGRMLDYAQTVFEAMAARPEMRLGELPALTASERHELLVERNRTRTNYSRRQCIHQSIEIQAARPAARRSSNSVFDHLCSLVLTSAAWLSETDRWSSPASMFC